MNLEDLKQYIQTDIERETLVAVIRADGNRAEAARVLGKAESTVRQSILNLKSRRLEGEQLSGKSKLIRHKHKDDSSTGKILEWIKTRVDVRQQLDAAKAVFQSMVEEIEPLPVIPYQNNTALNDHFTCIPLGDPHIGLLTWSKEVGEDWDLDIADRVYKKVFTRLLKKLPDTERCVLVNTGDFFHADNIQGMTSRSGHRLDLDGRHGKWLDAGHTILRMFIDACLRKYEYVEYKNVPGNHDDILGRALGSYAHQLYLNNPRCNVTKGDNPFQYYHQEEVLLGFAHGHTCKLPSLPGKMADDQYKLWGKSTYRQWITGHVHHNSWTQFKEHPGCAVETVGIIPPKDAYAHGGGYGAMRGIQGLVFDYKNGYMPTRAQEKVLSSD